MIGTIGEVALVMEKHKVAIKNVGLFKTNSDKDLAMYSFYWLSSDKAHEYAKKNLAGATQKYISLGKLRTFPFVLPPLSERNKISVLLSAIDKKTSIEKNKKQALDTLFKTLLSLLMTGKLRVKDLEITV
jgi:type I restriction enzyme S subunit